jgi:phosphatidylserine/phosphatidylglycerophosphate/cardiolipin synthase-like enzyme
VRLSLAALLGLAVACAGVPQAPVDITTAAVKRRQPAVRANPLKAKRRRRSAPTIVVPADPLDFADATWKPGARGPRRRAEGATGAAPGLRLTALYPAPLRRKGVKHRKHFQPEEALQITNTGPTSLALRGVVLEVRWVERKKDRTATMNLDADLLLEPGASVWLAADAVAFRKRFGHAPDGAVQAHGEKVRRIPDNWLALPDGRALVLLHHGEAGHVDTLAYNLGKTVWTPPGAALWTGPAVDLRLATAVTARRQLFARDRGVDGKLLVELDGPADFDSGTWHSAYGDDPVHRIWLPGQSSFNFPVHQIAEVEIVATSSPDNNYAALMKRFVAAKREILVSVYHFTNDDIADGLIDAAARGVAVTVWGEGVPVGGMPPHSKRLYGRLLEGGVQVYLLRGDRALGVEKRYRFDHSKYAIIDRTWVIAGTENYGYTGHPVNRKQGNRGWEVQLRSPEMVADLLAVWQADTARVFGDVQPGHLGMVTNPKPVDAVEAGAKSRDHGSERLNRYRNPVPVGRVIGPATVQLVVSPDNSLAESGAVIGMVDGAKHSLELLQNGIKTRWGRGKRKVKSLLLEAVLAAARRGVHVRVLLDGVFYQLDPAKRDGNDDTVRYLNALAAKEGLKLEARIVDLDALGLAKIHAKGVIADGRAVFVGSQNWNENSFRNNREVGFAIGSPAVAGYYLKLFERDWAASPLFRATVIDPKAAGLAKGVEVGVAQRRGRTCFADIGARRLAMPCIALSTPRLTATRTHVVRGFWSKVRGRVRGVHKGRSRWSLNFGERWRHDFSVIIPLSMVETLIDGGVPLSKLAGKVIEVEGLVVEENGPAVKLTAAKYLRLISQ